MTMSRAPIASSTSASMRPVSASPAMRKWRCRAAAGFSALPGPRSSTGSRRPRDGGLTPDGNGGPIAGRPIAGGGGSNSRLRPQPLDRGRRRRRRRWRQRGRDSRRRRALGRRFRRPQRRRGDFGNRLPNSPAARENSARPCRISCSARRDPRRPRAPRRRPCTGFAIRAGQDHRDDRPGLRRRRSAALCGSSPSSAITGSIIATY